MKLPLLCLLATLAPALPGATIRPFTIDTVMADLARTHPEATRVDGALPPGVVAHEDLVYSHPAEGDLSLDLYRPGGPVRLPAVIIVHGGGWVAGDRRMERPFARQLAARGYVVATVSYRLGRAGRFPAPVNDLKAAVRWLRAHADDYGIDASAIGAVGGSAGGSLATFIGASNGVAEFEGDTGTPGQSSAVQAVVDIDGSVTFLNNALIRSSETRPSPYFEFVHGIYSQNRAVWVAASPILYVSRQSAPVLFIKSTAPTPILAGRDEMCARLNILGIDSRVIQFPNTPHPFWLVHPWFERVVDETDGFLARHLKRPAAPGLSPAPRP